MPTELQKRLSVKYTPENWRIDPFKITDYEREQGQLEAFFVFCPAVAGKKASMIANQADDFIRNCGYSGTPFERIQAMIQDNTLLDNMQRSHIGKYSLLSKCYQQAIEANLDLRNVTVDELEKINGFGMKTSRFFILHSQKEANVAVIDTHVLKFLRDIGIDNVPDTIPTGKEYLRLEQIVLQEAEKANMKMSDFDLSIWSWYADGNKGKPAFLSESKLKM